MMPSVKLGPVEIAIPEHWEDRSMYAFVAPIERAQAGMSPKADVFRTNLVLTWEKVPSGATLEERVAVARGRIQATHGGKTGIDTAEGPNAGGHPSRRLRYQ